MRVLFMLVVLMTATAAQSQVLVEYRNGEVTENTLKMQYLITKSLQEVQQYIYVETGMEVRMKYHFKRAQMTIYTNGNLLETRTLVRDISSRQKHIREIMHAYNVYLRQAIIINTEGYNFGPANTMTLVNTGNSLQEVAGSISYIGYGHLEAVRTHYCYFNWEGNSIFRKTYTSFNECLKDM